MKAVIAGPRSAVVSWSPPKIPQGRITHYTVHWAGPGGRSHSRTRKVDPHSTHAVLDDLSHTSHQVGLS